VRQKDFRIPKLSVLESASEGEVRVIQMPSTELEEEVLGNECGGSRQEQSNDAVNNVI